MQLGQSQAPGPASEAGIKFLARTLVSWNSSRKVIVLDTEEILLHSLSTSAQLLRTMVTRELPGSSVHTIPRLRVMMALTRLDQGMATGDLAKHLEIGPGNLTQILDGLLSWGLITREPLDADRRVHVVRLTRKGLKEIRRLSGVYKNAVKAAFASLSELEKDQLKSILQKLTARLVVDPRTASDYSP